MESDILKSNDFDNNCFGIKHSNLKKITNNYNSKLSMYEISEMATIQEAFRKLNLNAIRAVFIVDENKRVVGIATDGDIRQFLEKFPDLKQKISKCMNRNFIRVTEDACREKILKMLDNHIDVIPVMNSENCLVDVVTRKEFPLKKQRRILARSKSPVRISFGGGGTDLTHYFYENNGIVVNATIKLFSHVTLRKRNDSKIYIFSADLNRRIEASGLEELLQNGPAEFALITSAVKLINPSFGFDLVIQSDFPIGSGLGGSAAVLSSILGCFNQFREDRWDNHELAELVFQIERLTLGIAGGWQDQYATVFGGFNYMEFSAEQNTIHSLKLNENILRELEENLILCYTNMKRNSGNIHVDQKNNYLSSSLVQELVGTNKHLTFEMKTMLLRGKLTEFGQLLHKQWELKKQFSDKISNPEIDNIYELAMKNGAIGGKLLGAGGGGFLMFYVQPFQRYNLCKVLHELGLKTEYVNFDHNGLQSWTVRDYIQ